MELRDDLLVGAEAAAAYLGIKPRSVYLMCKSGALPVIKKGRTLFFRKTALDKAFAGAAQGGALPERPLPARRPAPAEQTCTFSEMLPLFESLFEPDVGRRVALIGRMKNFLRLGGLDRESSGRGRTERFTGRQVWQLIIMMEFTTLGFPPLRSIELQRAFEKVKWRDHFIIDDRARLDINVTMLRSAMVEHLPQFFMNQRKKAGRSPSERPPAPVFRIVTAGDAP